MARARHAYELARAGQIDPAVAELEEAVRIAPANPLYRSALGGMYERQGKLEEAVAAFADAVRLDPANPALSAHLESVSLDWGAALARSRRFRAGLVHARATAERFPKSARAWLMLGLFETRNQENLAAVAAYRRARRTRSGVGRRERRAGRCTVARRARAGCRGDLRSGAEEVPERCYASPGLWRAPCPDG